MLIQRILTAAVILPLFLAALFLLPPLIWGVVVLGVVVLACAEWARLAALSGRGRFVFVTAVAAACILLAATSESVSGALLLAGAVAFWLAIVPLWLRRSRPVASLGLALAGWVVLVSSWYAIYLMQASAGRLLALLAVIWIADSAAYFVGRRFGRHKLAPSISPGKTWEGVAGAAVAVGVYYALLWLVIAPPFLTDNPARDFVLVAAMTALSIEGDLFESWMKRRAGVKDSGSLLPGHGGVLDRIDGVVAALPLAALVATLERG